MAPAPGVLGCPSSDCMRLHPTACVAEAASSGDLVARGRAGRDGQAALPGCGRTRFWSPGRTPGGFGQHDRVGAADGGRSVSYTHLRAHETVLELVCRLLLEKKNTTI